MTESAWVALKANDDQVFVMFRLIRFRAEGLAK